jgi:hypothetical protein
MTIEREIFQMKLLSFTFSHLFRLSFCLTFVIDHCALLFNESMSFLTCSYQHNGHTIHHRVNSRLSQTEINQQLALPWTNQHTYMGQINRWSVSDQDSQWGRWYRDCRLDDCMAYQSINRSIHRSLWQSINWHQHCVVNWHICVPNPSINQPVSSLHMSSRNMHLLSWYGTMVETVTGLIAQWIYVRSLIYGCSDG